MLNTLLLIGICLILGIASAKIMDKFSIPHVVGYISVGVLLGSSFLNIFSLPYVTDLNFISDLALGFIGFGMGEHFHLSELRALGKSIVIISIFEAFGTFLLVSIALFFLTKSLLLALIFGALASATSPAATVDVIEQYQAKGPLTTTLLAVIGIDDIIALLIFSLATPIALSFNSSGATIQLSQFLRPLMEIGKSLLLGFILAFPIDYFLDRITDKEEELLFVIASVLLTIGFAATLRLSVILSTLILGATTINLKHKNARYISQTLKRVGPTLYILFFVLVGANMDIRLLPKLGIIGVVYILVRGLGKVGGAYIGANFSKAKKSVKKYIGFALFSQAGVAVGLALSFSKEASQYGKAALSIKEVIVPTIVATTLIIQIIGPLLTKYALFASKEAGKKV